MVKEKIKPEEFEVSGGLKNGKIKWVHGSRVLKALGFSPTKCHIIVHDTGWLSIEQEDSCASYECGPGLWRKVPST